MGRQSNDILILQRRASRLATTALCVLLALSCLCWEALASSDAGSPGAFLRFGSSARSLALGGAVVALGDDAATAYWNPAGLSQLRTMELTAMSASLFADTRYSFVSIGMPSEGKGTFAFSGTIVSSGEFQRATEMFDMDDTFSEQEGIFSLSYARGGSRLGWGFTVKSVSQDIGGSNGSGFGADVGLYLRPDRRLSLGLSYQNALQPEITLEEVPEKLARTLRGGAALHFFNNRFLVLTDLVRTDFMDLDFQGGLEAWPLRQLVLRGGYDTVREQTSFGAGIRWQEWQLDYAHVSHDLGSTTVVGATMRFGIADGVAIRGDRVRFSPSGDDHNVSFGIVTALRGEIAEWSVEVRDEKGALVRRLFDEGPPPPDVTWSGEDENGRLVNDGLYTATVTVIDDLGQFWDHEVAVEILGFRNRTRTPIRIDISGSEGRKTGEGNR
ncbi:PorV/PorQ family protein [bacterium]|nr:PorV/PorQ family protein [bacterium]